MVTTERRHLYDEFHPEEVIESRGDGLFLRGTNEDGEVVIVRASITWMANESIRKTLRNDVGIGDVVEFESAQGRGRFQVTQIDSETVKGVEVDGNDEFQLDIPDVEPVTAVLYEEQGSSFNRFPVGEVLSLEVI